MLINPQFVSPKNGLFVSPKNGFLSVPRTAFFVSPKNGFSCFYISLYILIYRKPFGQKAVYGFPEFKDREREHKKLPQIFDRHLPIGALGHKIDQ